MNLFKDEIVDEYILWKQANPKSFSWWSFVNMKSDLPTALGFAKFFYPEIIEHNGCFILKDRFDLENFEKWEKDCEGRKQDIEKMMNLYDVKDFFHINLNPDEENEEQVLALGNAIQTLWSASFKDRYPERQIKVNLFNQYEELSITVYEE